MLAALFAGLAGAILEFNGDFSTTSGSSPITSATLTINRTGTLLFNNVAGLGSPEYSKNSGAWTAISEALTLAMSAGDTLAVRTTLLAPTSDAFDLRDSVGEVLIEEVILTRV